MNGESDCLLGQVRAALRGHDLVRAGETVLVAVSGGADSVALLLILSALQDEMGFALAVAHYEHGIRAEASREDAAFVQALCARLGIPCYVGHGDVPEMARAWRTSLEDAARRARYAFFDETAQKIGAHRIALAHQLEDQAETLLLHLVHGSGLQGLSGMRLLQGNRIRPLLGISRAALEAYLRDRGEAWREDGTNTDPAYTRNRLRHEVFPVLCQLNPRVSEAMARTADICAEAADTLSRQAQALLVGRTKRMPYGAFWLADGHLTPEAIRQFAEMAGVKPLEAVHVQAVLQLAPSETANLPGGWHALRTPERLHLIAPKDQWKPLEAPAFAQASPGEHDFGDGILRQAFDADLLAGAEYRYRRDGDIFAPMGGGTQKLKQTLRDAGIDRPFRDMLPLVAKGSRILWIAGLKPSADAAITDKTRRTTMLTYQGTLPWTLAPADDK